MFFLPTDNISASTEQLFWRVLPLESAPFVIFTWSQTAAGHFAEDFRSSVGCFAELLNHVCSKIYKYVCTELDKHLWRLADKMC